MMKRGESNSNLLAGILILAVVLSGIFAYYSAVKFGPRIVGSVTENEAYANLTVETSTEVNFTNRDINWGSGIVTAGQTTANIDTFGNIVRGNWTAVTLGLVLANIGNTNVTITMVAGKTNSTLLGGTTPAYNWMFTNNLSGSCVNDTRLDVWSYVNASIYVCSQLGYLTTANKVEIDFNLTIPYNALTGRRTDTITATATAAGS